MIYWFTGQPGSGKTTLARALAGMLRQQQPHSGVVHLDGEDLRIVTGNPCFSREGRRRNVDAMQKLALILEQQGLVSVVSMVSPYRDQRDALKRATCVVEFYTHTSTERGKEKYNCCCYEPPILKFIDVDTTGVTVGESTERIWQALIGMSVVI